ncbi:hypothetical protein [Sphingopyxis sp. BSNA05]|uniref:hypothetical protein n=1 Tax=Sphingopyxis sp. BSNA05 TaxID=1236614 RepID=UPI0020B8306B|nr:hypothetical protein [Sphingopyxis sp. BSNA05]
MRIFFVPGLMAATMLTPAAASAAEIAPSLNSAPGLAKVDLTGAVALQRDGRSERRANRATARPTGRATADSDGHKHATIAGRQRLAGKPGNPRGQPEPNGLLTGMSISPPSGTGGWIASARPTGRTYRTGAPRTSARHDAETIIATDGLTGAMIAIATGRSTGAMTATIMAASTGG